MANLVTLFDHFTQLLDRHVVNVRRRGHRVTGCCPFHDDRHPSFSADTSKGVWHCFGCGRQGGAKAFAELVGEPWTRPQSILSRKERRQLAAAARRREADKQARRILSYKADRRHDDLCAKHRDTYTTASWAADLLRAFHRWPALAHEFPDLVDQAEREYGTAHDALAFLPAQLDGEVEIV